MRIDEKRITRTREEGMPRWGGVQLVEEQGQGQEDIGEDRASSQPSPLEKNRVELSRVKKQR